jgi:hypothetical protein
MDVLAIAGLLSWSLGTVFPGGGEFVVQIANSVKFDGRASKQRLQTTVEQPLLYRCGLSRRRCRKGFQSHNTGRSRTLGKRLTIFPFQSSAILCAEGMTDYEKQPSRSSARR